MITDIKFDGERARRLRVDAGIKTSDLTRSLNRRGGGGSLHRTILNYESGRLPTTEEELNGIGKGYLNWLKERGYNPYNI